MLTQFLIFVLIVIWIIAGVYISMTSAKLGPYSINGSLSKEGDSFIQKAYTYATWAAAITWIILILIIIGLILSVIGVVALFSSGVGEAAEAYSAAGGDPYSAAVGAAGLGLSWLAIFFMVLLIGLLITTGILSSLTLTNIAQSKLYQKNAAVTAAYHDSLITMVLTFGSLFLLIIGFLLYYFLTLRQPAGSNGQKKLSENIE